MKKVCKFCKLKISKQLSVCDYNKKKTNAKFYECKNCQVIFQPDKIKYLYNNQDSSNYNLNKNFFYYLKQLILIFFILNLKNFFSNKKDILDYGCGSGELAIALSYFFKNKNIFTSDVFKLGKEFIPNIKKHFLLHKGQLKGKKFDLIIMRHVFEHIFDLKSFINQIKKNLKDKKSILIIEVPNQNSLWRKIMKSRWPGYFYPFHYYVFSNHFLKKFLYKNGFEILETRNLEPPIIGSFLLTFGFNKSICKFLSIFFYPLQFIISKFCFRSEAILLILKQK